MRKFYKQIENEIMLMLMLSNLISYNVWFRYVWEIKTRKVKYANVDEIRLSLF